MNDAVLLNDAERSGEKARRYARMFVILAMLFGMLLLFLEPPFVIPDENKHYLNVCRVSHGNIFVNVKDGSIGSYITAEELDFYALFDGKFVNNDNVFDLHSAVAHSQRVPDSTQAFFATTDATLNPTPYLIPAAVVAMCRFLFGSLNAFNSLFIARLANLLFYVIVIRWALMKTKALRGTMFLLALMPMSIFQACSASYDGCLIASSFLLFAYATRILLSPTDYQITREDIFAICFATVFIVGAKVAYAPLILLLLAIPIKKFGSLKRYFSCIGAVAAIGVLFYVVPAIVTKIITAGVDMPLTEAQILQQEYVKENFFVIPKVIYHTTKHFSGYWSEGFFGILGWLDTNFPAMFVKLFLIALSVSAVTELCSVKGIRWNARLLSLAGVTVFYVGTVYTMYVKWNPVLTGIVGGDLAYGGQGRYFIPIVLFLFLVAANPLLTKFKYREKVDSFREQAIPMVSFFYLGLTALMLFLRYWM